MGRMGLILEDPIVLSRVMSYPQPTPMPPIPLQTPGSHLRTFFGKVVSVVCPSFVRPVSAGLTTAASMGGGVFVSTGIQAPAGMLLLQIVSHSANILSNDLAHVAQMRHPD